MRDHCVPAEVLRYAPLQALDKTISGFLRIDHNAENVGIVQHPGVDRLPVLSPSVVRQGKWVVPA